MISKIQNIKQIRYVFKDFNENEGNRWLVWEFSSIMRLIDYKLVKKHRKLWLDLIETIKNKFKAHYKDYSESVIRDFCDTLITAKNDSLKSGKVSAHCLTDENLSMAVFDLFFAGIETTHQTFRWICTFISLLSRNAAKVKTRNRIENR